ncbi:RING-type E3 ubiquitin transferase [Pseudomonas sp. IT-347P]|uniref:dermonecrotic toxin domain-containing protein n=1 Tax=Pseudomonas sp. IT-347P TaxID=3026458 RepID=UPI0039DF7953
MTLSPEPALNADKGRHHELIKSAVSDSFKTLTLSRAAVIATTRLKPEPWYSSAPSSYIDKLAAANVKAWGSQNQVDHLLTRIDLYAFAEPLLKAKIKADYGIELDVKNTWLRLYMPKDLPWYAAHIEKAHVARTVSLLDAALHNFADSEKVDPHSQYISKPDKRGLFDVLPIKATMSVGQFQQLCRDLDIGAQYMKHLESLLLSDEPVAAATLQHKVSASRKDALAVAAHLALLKADIAYDAYKMVLTLAADTPQLLLNGRAMMCCDLSILGTRLTGVLLLIHKVRDNRGVRRVICYVPHDPEHPLKEYESLRAFKDELTRQLREDKSFGPPKKTYTYRQFFSQFVDQQERGHFFAALDDQLFITRHHPRADPTDQQEIWRKEPRTNPHMQFRLLPLQGDYWGYVYRQAFNKILNDARVTAVSTADTDTNQRWAWWDNFKKIASDIFNAALLIATPFVPGVGELMMAWTAYQIGTEVVEGLVDIGEGLWQEVVDHVISVVTEAIQFAAFAAGANIGDVFKLKLSPLVESMKPVRLPDGKPALWHADLAPYEQKDLSLPSTSQPDNHGLHRYGSNSILPLDGKLYSVEKTSTHPDSRTHRIKHPRRANAYRPTLEHNGHGAWLHEAENPGAWTDATLMQRLGHKVERFSPAQLEQIRISSGTEPDALRQMHNEHQAPPPLLTDAINRVAADDDARSAIDKIRAGQPLDPQSAWFEPIATALPGWPRERAIKIEYDHLQWNGYTRKYGNPAATEANTLTISQTDLNSGRLPERLNGFLDDSEMNALLGRDVPPADRPQALRDLLADAVEKRQDEVSQYLYRLGERTAKADLRVVKQTFPDLPLPLAEKLLSQAKAAELQRIAVDNRLPLRLKTQARELDFEAAGARAYDGFYHEELLPDTERLALFSLKTHTGSFADLRIEVRDGTFDGPLRASAGPQEASLVRRLIRNESGRYEVLDGNNRSLHDADDFYRALLNALPDEQRTALGYTRDQGWLLKDWIMEKTASVEERRTLLAAPPIRPVAPLETETLLRGWPKFWGDSSPEQRIKALYPKMDVRERNAFLKALQNKGDPVEAIKRLESDREHLRRTLQGWRESYPPEIDSSGEPIHGAPRDYLHNGGQRLEQALIECFERKSEIFGERSSHPEQGYTLDLSSEFPGPNLERWWKDLRQRPGIDLHLARISALKLDNARFSAGPDGLLNSFPHLRQLSARQCELTEVPAAITQMRQLRDLDLADNRIVESAEQVRDLRQLETLNLNGNPLRYAPDVGQMDRLTELSLANTRLQSWPQGLFESGGRVKPRPRRFMLDMRDTPINDLPEVTPGSDQAFILSRARWNTSRLSPADMARLGDYRESTGFARQQVFVPAARDELVHWQQFPEDEQGFGPSVALKKYRDESWHDLMAEPDSEGFFSVIRHQRFSEDYRHDRSRRRLTKRVWDMIEAATLDSQLREKLFRQVVAPNDCGDLGAQLFNSLGLKVLVSKAYAESFTPEELESRLVRLARSAARLERLNDLAKEEYSRQEQQNLITPNDPSTPPPDEVEIHLAYETGLAGRLDLPWESEGMLYQARSGVDQRKIDAAYERIITFEKGDGLLSKMVNPGSDAFWEHHLRNTWPQRFADNDALTLEKFDLLDELRRTQNRWAAETDVKQLTPLGKKLTTLADQLGIDHLDVFSGEAMSEARYNKYRDDIGYAHNDLSRQLTREALVRAGL